MYELKLVIQWKLFQQIVDGSNQTSGLTYLAHPNNGTKRTIYSKSWVSSPVALPVVESNMTAETPGDPYAQRTSSPSVPIP